MGIPAEKNLREPQSGDKQESITTWIPEMGSMPKSALAYEVDADNFIVSDDTSLALSGDKIKSINQAHTTSENLRQLLVRPLNEHVKRINTAFKVVTGPLGRGKEILVGKRTDYIRERDRAQKEKEEVERKEKEEAALKLAESLEAAGDDKEAAKIIDDETTRQQIALSTPKPTPIRGTESTTYTVTVWDFEISDINQVPGEFLLVERKAVMGEIRQQAKTGNAPAISGLVIKKDIQTRVR